MTKEIMIEILDPCVLAGEEFSVALIDGVEKAIAFRYSIVDVRTDAVIVQSGETDEPAWETTVSAAGNYYIKVEATFDDGGRAKAIEPLWVSTIYTSGGAN